MTGVTDVRREPKGPGFLYGGATIAMVMAILMVALTAQRDAPPTIAEIAPQAVEQITEAPEEQASDVGSGPGAGSGGASGGEGSERSTTTTTSPEQRVIERASVRRCVGNPPRQIEDPQSPPCVAFWEGDNGGATYQGVTEDEILVAVGDPGPGQYPQAMWDAFANFFNKRFEFYGRKLRLQTYTPAPAGAGVEAMHKDAAFVDEEMKAFASLSYSSQVGIEHIFFDELARRKVLSVVQTSYGMPWVDQEHLRRNAPYQWNYTPTADIMLRHIGEVWCKNLAGKNAAHAGVPENTMRRKLGVIIDSTYKAQAPLVDIGPLREMLTACDEEMVIAEHQAGTSPAPVLLNLRDQDVTTILYTGQTPILSVYMMPAASQQGYHPEWFVSNFGHQDDDSAAQYFSPNQAENVIGVQVYNKMQPNEELPSTWALREGDPTHPGGFIYHWVYESLLVLASGIQMAGPNLTPESFQEGLFKTKFPNPGAGGPPYYQGTVGFPGMYSMQQDVSAIWLNPTERSMWTGTTPAYCYVNRGQRYKLGQWPTDLAFRTGPCR